MQEIGLEPVGCTGHEPAGIRQRESTCPATIAAAGLNERQGITMSPIDLSTSYLGLQLANPFIAGASPLSDHLDTVRRLEDAGCAAIVLHSLFEEQISQRDTGRIHHMDPLDRQFATVAVVFPGAGSVRARARRVPRARAPRQSRRQDSGHRLAQRHDRRKRG